MTSLADARPGLAMTIVAVDGPDARALRDEGIVPGAVVTVERRLALGGPVMLRLGSVRLAVARSAVRGVLVRTAR